MHANIDKSWASEDHQNLTPAIDALEPGFQFLCQPGLASHIFSSEADSSMAWHLDSFFLIYIMSLQAQMYLNIKSRLEKQKMAGIRLYLEIQRPVDSKRHITHRVAILHSFLTSLMREIPFEKQLSKIPQFISFYELKRLEIPTRKVLLEIRKHLPGYEKLVTTLLNYPYGKDTNPIKMGRLDRVQEVYDMFVRSEFIPQKDQDECVGELLEKRVKLLQVRTWLM